MPVRFRPQAPLNNKAPAFNHVGAFLCIILNSRQLIEECTVNLSQGIITILPGYLWVSSNQRYAQHTKEKVPLFNDAVICNPESLILCTTYLLQNRVLA